MKILEAEGHNFGSYEHIEIIPDGLTLIQGPTGAGKSTFMDLAAWVLFGRTAKDIAADDVRKWGTKEPTIGTAIVQAKGKTITVARTRGRQGQNDLNWCVDGGTTQRGRDLVDSQKKLDELLGMTYETFVTGSYFHEFSPTGSFFVSKAKERRELFEEIANMAFPIKLAERASTARKNAKNELRSIEDKIARLTGQKDQIERQIKQTSVSLEAWDRTQAAAIAGLEKKVADFDKKKAADIAALEKEPQQNDFNEDLQALRQHLSTLTDKRCQHCGNVLSSDERHEVSEQLRQLERKIDRAAQVERQLAQMSKVENPYISQLEREKKRENTLASVLKHLQDDLSKVSTDLGGLSDEKASIDKLYNDLDAVYKLSFDLRTSLLLNTVQEIQDETNSLLETTFDAALRVEFAVSGGDALDVSVYRSGNLCNYKQLSKGQRGLLKLCFSVAVMESCSRRSGIDFGDLFFDEALDGLDPDLKVKAFDLFAKLSINKHSVHVIDHAPELQQKFTNLIRVSLIDDTSVIDEG